MSEYIVSARKYRPLTFSSVVGQGAIATTLKNAIQSGKLAHAYLFCGPRGVGKTTCARIFAKTINCMNPQPDGEACGQCESCLAFQEQRSMNIHELDAASNNSVDDIRSLIEQVRIPLQIGRYKVFIIDEVHMLSTAAFNAFLKTLEEPPAHAIFILATTEKHKILPTILSRCQIYDFQRMSVDNIVSHLSHVAQEEGYTVEPEALNIIAQKADGGMRDALSIFDQVVSYTGGQITYQRVIENLNVLDYDYYFRLVDLMLEQKIPDAMLLYNEILGKGFDGGPFISGLASHLRDLLVSRDPATTVLLEASDEIRQRYAAQAQRCRPQWLYRAISLCNQCDLSYRTSRNKRLQVELCIIECAQATTDDEPGAGRRPARRLKPIFDRSATGVAGMVQPARPQHQSSQTTSTTATNAAATRTTTSAAQTATPTAGRRPLPRLGKLAPSINKYVNSTATGGATAAASVNAGNQSTMPAATPPTELDRPVEALDFQLQWQGYAGTLPVEDTALAQRMHVMQAQLSEEDGHVVATINVENKDVRAQMQALSSRGLLEHLRSRLHNASLELRFEVVSAGATVHVYSKHEQLRILSERLPQLPDLVQRFDLELV